MDSPAIASCGGVLTGKIQFVMYRVVDAACDDLCAAKAGDADAPVRAATHEIGSAVNRIYHPGCAGRAGLVAVFLTHNAVFGKISCDRLAKQQFNAAVGVTDKIIAAFLGNLEFIDFPEMVKRHSAAVAGELLY